MTTSDTVNQAISYIMNHLEENLTIEMVADACHFSKYYFSRIFKNETGESLYAFIKRMRMEQSAFRLKVEHDRSITEIGMDYGYTSGNYSQSFQQHHKESPIQFRNEIADKSKIHPFFPDADVILESYEECNSKVDIMTLPDYFVLYERSFGNYNEMTSVWNNFVSKNANYITEDTIFFERTFDDPTITDSENCLYDLCLTVPKDCALPNTYTLKGGKFAVYHYHGYPKQIYSAYQSMFNVWFKESGYHIDKRYGFDLYRKIDCDTMYLDLDICIPIE